MNNDGECYSNHGGNSIWPYPSRKWGESTINSLYISGIASMAAGKNLIIAGTTLANPVMITIGTNLVISGAARVTLARIMEANNATYEPWGRAEAINYFMSLVGPQSGYENKGGKVVFNDLTGLLSDADIAAYQNDLDNTINSLPLNIDIAPYNSGFGMGPNLGGNKGLMLPGGGTSASPIILDLDGNGVKSKCICDGVMFDNNGNRLAEATGWVDTGDALLVRDLNGDGQIDSGAELFGNNTILKNGSKAANGFEALKELDSNHDGVVDANDAEWSTLQLWQDTNGNGIVDVGELMTLEEAGVKSLNVAYQQAPPAEWRDENGNQHRQTGSYTREDGTTADMTDVWFLVDPPQRRQLDMLALSEEVAGLPDVKGYGDLYDLSQAMMRDESGRLAELVAQFVEENDPSVRRGIAEEIILTWTDSTANKVVNINAYDISPLKINALMVFYGYADLWGRTMLITPEAAPYYIKNFDLLVDYVESTLNAQTHYSKYADAALSVILFAKLSKQEMDINPLVTLLQDDYNNGDAQTRTAVVQFVNSYAHCGEFPSEMMAKIREMFIESRPAAGNLLSDNLTLEERFSLAGLYIWDQRKYSGSPWIPENVEGLIIANSSAVSGTDGNDIIYGIDSGCTVYGGKGNDIINGGQGNDILYGDNGDDTLLGGGGNDTLYGGYGDDILHGGAGDDRLCGAYGNDIYLFGRGDGHDTVVDDDWYLDVGNRNVVRLGQGIGVDDIELLTNPAQELIIRIKDTGETLTIYGFMSYSKMHEENTYAMQVIEFADGTVWEYEEILKRPMRLIEPQTIGYTAKEGSVLIGNDLGNQLNGGSGDDTLIGGSGNDTLNGGAGNDILWGGAGNDRLLGFYGDDVYLFGIGDGHDTITETDISADKRNVIRLGEGIGVDDIELVSTNYAWNYMDLVIRLKSTGESLTISRGLSNYYNSQQNSNSIQAIEFTDGTVWEWADIVKQKFHAGEKDTTIYADIEGSFLVANDLGNTLNGGFKADTLYGGAGNDMLNGSDGDDILCGGGGNDRLYGGAGNDVYLFGIGDGHNTIYESETRADRRNVIRLGVGIGADDIELVSSNYAWNYMDLVIRLKSKGESLSVNGGLSPYYSNQQNSKSIQAIEFADGTVWEWSDIMKQKFHAGEKDTTMYAEIGGSILVGNDLNNTLHGSSGNDILHGGKGDDILNGSGGNDTYLFNCGDGKDTIYDNVGNDSLIFGDGIGIDDLWFSRSGNDLVINVLGTQDQVKVQYWYYWPSYQVESIQANGMELVNSQMEQMIQALASFGVPKGVDGHWTDEQREEINSVIGSSWQPKAV